jgi:hypothetical protein
VIELSNELGDVLTDGEILRSVESHGDDRGRFANLLRLVRFTAEEGFEDVETLVICRVETVVVLLSVLVPDDESFRVSFLRLRNFVHFRNFLRSL